MNIWKLLTKKRTFKFDIGLPRKSNIPPPSTLPELLVDVMQQMENLNKFYMVIPEFHTQVFEDAFKSTELVFPQVQTLVVGPYSDFMVASCPNVVAVGTNGYSWARSHRQYEEQQMFRESGYTTQYEQKQVPNEHTIRLINALAVNPGVKRLEIHEWWNVYLAESKSAHHSLGHY